MLFRPFCASALRKASGLLLLSTLAVPSALMANTVDKSLSVSDKTHQAMAKSQKTLNKLDEQTQGMLTEYQFNQRQADITEAYNAQLQRLINSQGEEISALQEQITSVERTEQAMLPLLSVMVAKLAEFVAQDLPFLPDERSERIAKLTKLLDRADVSIAEKYRQILEAYLVEVGYGRTIEAYSERLINDDNNTHVNYLRVGRMALYYQGLNGQEGALWLPAQKTWMPLASAQNLELSKALQMAQQQRVPELLDLPVPAMAKTN